MEIISNICEIFMEFQNLIIFIVNKYRLIVDEKQPSDLHHCPLPSGRGTAYVIKLRVYRKENPPLKGEVSNKVRRRGITDGVWFRRFMPFRHALRFAPVVPPPPLGEDFNFICDSPGPSGPFESLRRAGGGRRTEFGIYPR
jgi:hypothetical protein